jgi:hypothetical protein
VGAEQPQAAVVGAAMLLAVAEAVELLQAQGEAEEVGWWAAQSRLSHPKVEVVAVAVRCWS